MDGAWVFVAAQEATVNDKDYIRWFSDLGVGDVAMVGGKTASLGELYSALSGAGVKVPPGFAITAAAYRDALTAAGAWAPLHQLLHGLDKSDVDLLAERAAAARKLVYEATGGSALRRQIVAAYRALKQQCGGGTLSVAVRSSATAEDLPNASFAGQHDSYLNVRGEAALIEACRNCFASLFTERAIGYRLDNGFDHFKVALSVAVMKMVRSDLGSSGVIFTLDTETGFRDVVFVTGGYGLGENIVQGAIDPDEFYVHKPTYRKGFRTVLARTLGAKQLRMTYGADPKAEGEDPEQADIEGRPGAVLPFRPGGPRPGWLCNRHRGPLFAEGWPTDADGHRVGEGRRGRGSLHRSGAAGDGGLAPRSRHDP